MPQLPDGTGCPPQESAAAQFGRQDVQESTRKRLYEFVRQRQNALQERQVHSSQESDQATLSRSVAEEPRRDRHVLSGNSCSNVGTIAGGTVAHAQRDEIRGERLQVESGTLSDAGRESRGVDECAEPDDWLRHDEEHAQDGVSGPEVGTVSRAVRRDRVRGLIGATNSAAVTLRNNSKRLKLGHERGLVDGGEREMPSIFGTYDVSYLKKKQRNESEKN